MILTTLGVILLMSLVCIGVFVSMQEGMVLNFLRQPVLDRIKIIENKHKINENHIKLIYYSERGNYENPEHENINKARLEHDASVIKNNENKERQINKFFYLKPFVLCVYCFASFWGSLVFWLFHWFYLQDVNYTLIPLWIISVFICVVFNAVFDALMRKINVYE